MPNKILPIDGSSDERARIAQTNANFAKLDADTITKAYKGPTGKDAVIEGQLPGDLGSGILMNDLNGVPNIYLATKPDGTPVLKVGKSGFDATTTSDRNLIFNSAQNIFKVAYTDSVTVPNPGAGAFTQSTVTVDTGVVSSTPLACTAFIQTSGYAYPLPYMFPAKNGTYGGFLWIYRCSTKVSSGQIQFRVDCDNFDVISGPGSATVKYYILQESAT